MVNNSRLHNDPSSPSTQGPEASLTAAALPSHPCYCLCSCGVQGAGGRPWGRCANCPVQIFSVLANFFSSAVIERGVLKSLHDCGFVYFCSLEVMLLGAQQIRNCFIWLVNWAFCRNRVSFCTSNGAFRPRAYCVWCHYSSFLSVLRDNTFYVVLSHCTFPYLYVFSV